VSKIFVAVIIRVGLVVFVWHHSIARPQKPRNGRKDLPDISHRLQAELYSRFCLKFRCHGNLGQSYGRICLTSFNSEIARIPYYAQASRDISHTSWVIAHFVSNFVAMATWLVVVEFVWHHSIARPSKPPVGRRDLLDIWDLLDISYTSRVIADFVPNFVAMATGLVVVEFGWHHLIARPRKPRYTQRHSSIDSPSAIFGHSNTALFCT